jgi:hypothetical protein
MSSSATIEKCSQWPALVSYALRSALRSEMKSESSVELQREVFYFRDHVQERGRPVSEIFYM